MRQFKNVLDIWERLRNDENLHRLLYYQPKNFDDDPLSPDKTDILTSTDRFRITDERIKRTPLTTDLTTLEICRICVYPGRRYPGAANDNYRVANQDVIIDIYVHMEKYDSKDFRLSKLCDYIDETFFDKKITGIGAAKFRGGYNVTSPPKGYIGYQLVYSFGSVKG